MKFTRRFKGSGNKIPQGKFKIIIAKILGFSSGTKNHHIVENFIINTRTILIIL